MNAEKPLARPDQVTIAGLVAIGVSAAMVVVAFSKMSALRTIEGRAAVQRYVTTGPGRELGVDPEQAMTLARIGLFLTGAFAAVAIVAAWFALRRDRASRVVLAVVAVPMAILGIFAGPLLFAGFLGFSAVMMFTQPASDWFAGRSPSPVARAPRPGSGEPGLPPPRPDQPGQPPASWPVAGSVPGAPGSPSGGYAVPARPIPDRRPVNVLIACLLTWGMTTLTVLVCGVAVYAITTDEGRDAVARAIRDSPQVARADLTVDQLVLGMQVMVGLFALWAIAAAVVAIFVLRGSDVARILLVVSAAIAGLLGLVSAVGAYPLAVVTLACGGSIWLLFRRDSNDWFRSRKQQPLAPPPGPDAGRPPTQPW